MAAKCNDLRCPIHGQIKVRGNVFTGTVVSAKSPKTVIVERILSKFVPKYERYRKIRSRITAHNPDCLKAKEGSIVRIGETRKISKTKSFVVLNVEGQENVRVREAPHLEKEEVKMERETLKEAVKEKVEAQKVEAQEEKTEIQEEAKE